MTAIVLPDIDRSTIEELKKRIPDLTEIELTLPTRKELNKTAKDVGKTARDVSKTTEETIDSIAQLLTERTDIVTTYHAVER